MTETQRQGEYRINLEDELDEMMLRQSLWLELAALARDMETWARRIERLAERLSKEFS